MAPLGMRGGEIASRARADSMTAARRKEIAAKAARARWGATGYTFAFYRDIVTIHLCGGAQGA